MGIFANAPEGDSIQGGWIGETPAPRQEAWHGESGFEAMGHVVPMFRRAVGEAHLKDMGFNKPGDSEKRYDIVARMAAAIERDNSHEAMEAAYKAALDVTGVYRLLAILLTAEPAGVEPDEPATYLDLVGAA